MSGLQSRRRGWPVQEGEGDGCDPDPRGGFAGAVGRVRLRVAGQGRRDRDVDERRDDGRVGDVGHAAQEILGERPAAHTGLQEPEKLTVVGDEPSHGARFRIVLNKHEFFVHHPHHGNEFAKPEVKHLRECLAAAGVTLSRYEEGL